MAIRKDREYKQAIADRGEYDVFDPLGNLNNTFNSLADNVGMPGQMYNYGGGGGAAEVNIPNPDTGFPTPYPITPKGNDISLKLINGSGYKDKLSFKILNESYNENAVVALDSNQINDVLTIKPNVADGYISKNYFVVTKELKTKEIEVFDDVIDYGYFAVDAASSLFNYTTNITIGTFQNDRSIVNRNIVPNTQITRKIKTQKVQKAGIRVEEVNDDIFTIIGTYAFPANLDLEFKIEKTAVPEPIKKTFSTTKEIFFVSNYSNDKLLNDINIHVSNGIFLKKAVKLNDTFNVTTQNDETSAVRISITGFSSFVLKNVRWQYSNKFNDYSDFNIDDFNILTNESTFTIPSDVFINNIILLIEVEPNTALYPKLTLDNNTLSKNIIESIFASPTKSDLIGFDFNLQNTDFIKIKTPYREFNYDISAVENARKHLDLDLKRDFLNNEGSFKVILVPSSKLYGDGPVQSIIINIAKVFDTPILDEIDYPQDVYIPTYTFGDVKFDVKFKSNLATKVIVYHTSEDTNNLIGNYGGSGTLTLNYNELKNKKLVPLNLIFVPFNNEVRGEVERINITFTDDGIYVSTQDLKQNLFGAIRSALNPNLLAQPKYLTHLASFDIDDKEILISTWEDDLTTFTKFKKDEVGNDIPDGDIHKSIVLKLYEPLPPTINKNDTLWVSRLMSLPIIQRVIVSSNPEDDCIPLRAPNFKVDVSFVQQQSTGLESYDDLILSGSETSQQIIDKYLNENIVDTDRVNIDYSIFSNFIKYSSAAERLANFKYKKELSEYYDDKITFLSASNHQLESNGHTSIDRINEINSYKTKKSTLITGLDGWEKDLLSGSKVFTTDSASYNSFPGGRFNLLSGENAFNNNGIDYVSSPNNTLYTWYEETYQLAADYDKENRNLLKNNIPTFISEDDKNADFLLFLDMIGNHFDIIYTYIKGITDQRLLSENNSYGINDEMLYSYLESFGWDAKNLNSNKQLWSYVFGTDGDGNDVLNNNDGYTITPEQYTKGVWRRIANNLPYLLKHKGTTRGIKALLTCYGIPQSSLSIMEFGGPEAENVQETSKYVYEVKTSTLVFNTGSYVSASWVGSHDAIEFRVKPIYSSSVDLVSGSGFKISISGSGVNEKVGSLQLMVNGSTIISSSAYTFFDGNFHSVLVQKEGNTYSTYYGTAEKDRVIKNEGKSASGTLAWDSGSQIVFGNFDGEMDEIRIWKTALSSSVFNVHLLNPEATNGNHISASTEDLLVRLDFEYPHSLYPTGTIKNIAPNNSYMNEVSASGFVSASSFNSSSSQHWNYKYIDRDVAVEIPNTGASRFANNKVRFESQEFLLGETQLSPARRVTKHSYDSSRIDSNRVGLFFSPNRDLDLDIAKSIGGDSIDDYFGDPTAQYDYSYKDLDNLRNYYFERVSSRNIYEFIRLIKFYDKSLFVNLKQMLPARALATTGLLIAPHILERSKHKINKPEADFDQYETTISDTTINVLESTFDTYESNLTLSESVERINGEYTTFETTFVAEDIYNFGAENNTFEATIGNIVEDITEGQYITYDGTIDYKRTAGTILTDWDIREGGQIVGMDNKYIDYGFNTYFNNGYGKYYYDENGVMKSKGIRAFLVTKADSIIVQSGSISGSMTNVLTSSLSTELIIQELGVSASLVDGTKILASNPANGYLTSHYTYKRERHTGTENLFFKGSKQTSYIKNDGTTGSFTTIDGKGAVEVFTTNPTTLRVTAQGRSKNEPILEVD